MQFWMNKRDISSRQYEYVVFITFGFSIILCMLFPFKISEGFIFDLRFISFILACFYAHPITAASLGVLVAVIRGIHGGDGAWIPIIILPILFTVCMVLRPVFNRNKVYGRIFIPTFLTFLTCIAVLVCIHVIFQHPLPRMFVYSFIIIHVLGIILSIYLIEFFRSQNLILTRLIRMEKVEVVSHLAASISHEVRNPLTSSRGFVQMVQESPDLKQKDKEFLSIAVQEMDRATAIIHDYLTFAKPAPDKIDTISTKETIERAIGVIQPLANMNNVIIHSRLSTHHVEGNQSLFLQALINLLKNSIEAMPQGGEIRVASHADSKKVHILIEDDGIGMTPLQVTRLGEPYFSTKDGKGTGLGMMVVFRVIEAMNGEIQVDSEPGAGTKINVCLPIAADEV